ncbi:DUF4271 domain-containing protein [Salegentibacter sp. F188]|uniref:DUF4271 domain-containing protein n=1 Tax=Autumnicola patrickiae TaxID=3075591 RepID=A0ABU3E485_9FLAO|nr:DUF4271 domain-containing protein [Salegentibacter sp. F188]MDT0690715.1 DUF4271 domain-containing protein [Salegentibacter sp. F188]
MQAIERQVDTTDWMTLILLTCIVMLAAIKIIYPQRFQEFMSLLTSSKFMMFKGKENQAFHPFNILMFFVNIAAVSLFLLILLNFFFPTPEDDSSIIIYIRIATAYGSFVLLKMGIEKIIANVFELDEKIDYYLFRKLGYRNFISLFVLLAAILLTYSFTPTRPILYSILGFLIVSNVISLIVIYRQNQSIISINLFYFILYLCALEIAPYIILYKLFINNWE